MLSMNFRRNLNKNSYHKKNHIFTKLISKKYLLNHGKEFPYAFKQTRICFYFNFI